MSAKPNGANEAAEWIDGFLFVGNHLALDFLNTKLINDGETIELLPDLHSFERWLIAARATSRGKLSQMVERPETPCQTERLVSSIRDFRELLREAVFAIEAGRMPSQRSLLKLSDLLLQYPRHFKLSRKSERLEKEAVAETFWALLADASAALLTSPHPSRIRKCENCVVHFQDISKKGSRRWCSMDMCGNKLKVAAYQQRRRAAGSP